MKSYVVFAVAMTLVSGFDLPAADRTWQRSDGGALDVPANWGIASFSSGDAYKVEAVQSADLTLTADWSPYKFFLNTHRYVLNLAGNKLLASDRVFLKLGADVLLTNGTLGVSGNERVIIGDYGLASGDQLTLQGNGAHLAGSQNNQVIVGQNARDCRLVVRDGATMTGSFTLGQNSGATGNLLLVDGVGSRVETTSARDDYVGGYTGGNRLCVTNGGLIKTSGKLYVSSYTATSDPAIAGGGNSNVMTVVDGGRAEVTSLVVGGCGDSNRFEVAEGGVASLGSLQVGRMRTTYDAATKTTTNWAAVGNAAYIAGEDSVCTAKDIYVGRVYTSDGRLEVRDGGRVVCNGEFYVGFGETHSSNDTFVVGDGGEFDYRGTQFCLGYAGYAGTRGSFGSSFCIQKGGRASVELAGDMFVGMNALALQSRLLVEGDLSVSVAKKASVYLPWRGQGANLEVVGGTATFTNCQFSLGVTDNATCSNGVISISNGGVLRTVNESAEDHRFSFCAPGSGVLVDSGTMDVPSHHLGFGCGARATGNWLKVVNGGRMNARRIVLGDALGASMLVSNGVVTVCEHFDAGYSIGTSVGGEVVFAGTNSSICVTNGTIRLFADTAIKVIVPEETMASPLFKGTGLETVRAGDSNNFRHRVSVVVPKSRGRSQNITLVETTDKAIQDAEFSRLDFDLPAGVSVRRETRKIILHVSSTNGMILLVR